MLRKLGIEPGERVVFAWGVAALLLLGWTDVSVKNVSETFFLKRVGVEYLPWVFLVNGALLVLTTWVFGRVAARRDRLRLLPQTLLGLALVLVPLWVLVSADASGAFVLLVIASKQITSIALLVFWIAMGDLLYGRQAKRLFAPMMAGVTLGTIFGSFASAPLAGWLEIEGLLPFSAGMLALGAAATLPLRRLRPQLDAAGVASASGMRVVEEASAPTQPRSAASLWRDSWLFRLLVGTALCSGLLGPMLYFQFQYVADLSTSGAGAEDQLMAFYARFRGWIGVLVLLAQLLVTSSLYRRVGVPLAAAFSPIVYLLGFLGLSLRLSLPAGVGAMAGTKLQDNAVYDPALRVLFNLFPEEFRSRASGLIEGPVKRAGGALGSAVVLLALWLGTARSVGFVALPIAAAWLAVALLLWRRYPQLLLQASAKRSAGSDALDAAELLDPGTIRSLTPELRSARPERCRAAVELISEAGPALAVGALAEALHEAPASTRSLLVAGLDRLLEAAVVDPVANAEAAGHVEGLLAGPERLSVRDRADLVQAYGRLTIGDEGLPLLEQALADSAAAVRLAALAALCRREAAPADAPALHAALESAAGGADAVARRTAREELRALLLAEETDAVWERRLALLATLLEHDSDRAETAEALAEIALRRGERAGVVSGLVVAQRDETDPRVRASLLRYVGRTRLHSQACWLVEHLGSDRREWSEAAREGLCSLGPLCTDTLLRELSFGKRSKREGILLVLRDLRIGGEALRELYDREVEAIQADLLNYRALGDGEAFAMLRQRLEERVGEKLHPSLLFLSAIRDERRIAELAAQLRRLQGGRRHAILLEALEALLGPQEKSALVPLLEDRPRRQKLRDAAAALRRANGSPKAALLALVEDSEELTRTLALALAEGTQLEDHDGVLGPVEKMMHLKTIPLFEGLTTRQLMDLAEAMVEVDYADADVVVREGEQDDCLYVILEGTVRVEKNGTTLAEIGSGEFFGEVALFEGVSRSATAIGSGLVRALRLERSDMLRLIEDRPGIAISILQTVSRRIRELTDRLVV